jgi:hypothetical protein
LSLGVDVRYNPILAKLQTRSVLVIEEHFEVIKVGFVHPRLARGCAQVRVFYLIFQQRDPILVGPGHLWFWRNPALGQPAQGRIRVANGIINATRYEGLNVGQSECLRGWGGCPRRGDLNLCNA